MNLLLALLIPGVADLAAGHYFRALGIALGILCCYALFLPLGLFWHALAIGHSWRVIGTF